ncbi:trypsin-like peptidase domain-containing protein [Leptolyngbya sp. FACHB-541]|uniref:HhoA/HhoB/HtrA family serine endopeptidase n=1 Tax=Leptolyngbya sp. FACHB-541 TaxID=2692810 RepID=UPI001683DA59|nr:HhoA/HhoB/HtrA family serine endopeptidase [Leptolyngbya sp. FACHB-541]MBD1996257.1 trypsin-like peptidase domain-containing protein [Leptolyngbya sp. FACHB-541]
MQHLLKHSKLYLAVLLLSGSAGCSYFKSEATQAQNFPFNLGGDRPTLTSPNFIAEVVQSVGPAVVRIDATRTVETPSTSNNPIIERFFGNQFGGEFVPPEQRVQQGTGSGFIISEEGHIITNAHVVDGADSVNVVLKDGRSFEGEVLGADPITDIAVIKVEADALPTVELGDSKSLVPGQWAIAIGNPLGLNNTVTQGIISATGRRGSDIGIQDKRLDFIQTDAAINPGNSGGPLLNAEGAVIGVNTAIIQGAQGLGFAIPIDQAERIAEQLIETGRVEHPYLGVRLVELTPEIQAEINQSDIGITVSQDEGVLIVAIAANSPAAQAGLQPGDIITQVNDVAIETADQVQDQVETTPLGEPLQLTVNRNGSTQQLTVRPEQLPIGSQ